MVDSFGHGFVRKQRAAPEDVEAATLIQSNYLSIILNTNVSGQEPALDAAVKSGAAEAPAPKSPSKFAVHNSKVLLTTAQKEVWSKAVLKKGAGSNTLDHEVGTMLPFDKNLTLG